MKAIPWRVYRARVERAKKLTRGRRVRVEIFFSKEDLLLIALRGYALTSEGLGAFVRDHAVADDLRRLRCDVPTWAPISKQVRPRGKRRGLEASDAGGRTPLQRMPTRIPIERA